MRGVREDILYEVLDNISTFSKNKDSKCELGINYVVNHLNYNELQDMILKSSEANQAAAGEYRIFDAVSLQILKRSKIKVLITSGKDLNEFEKFWQGKKHVIGTVISN